MTQDAAVVLANPAPQSSVELSQTAKSGTQACVKVYSSDPEAAMLAAIRLYDLLVARYAQPSSARHAENGGWAL